MPRRMSPSANPRRTFSNATGASLISAVEDRLIGLSRAYAGHRAVFWGTNSASASVRPSCASKNLVPEIECELGQEHVCGDDHDVGNDHGLGGGAAHALCSSAHRQTFVASDGRQD